MTIEKIIPNLNAELSKVLKKNFAYAVVRKRSPLWFFKNAMQYLPESKPEICSTKPLPVDAKPKKKLSSREIHRIWHGLDPESKRKYFNMAELDELRYKEQRACWMAAVGSVLGKSKVIDEKVIDQAIKQAPNFEKLHQDFIDSLEQKQVDYDRMIQLASLKTLYKNELKTALQNDNRLSADQLADNLPDIFRPVISKPRKPPAPFFLYLFDHLQELVEQRRQTKDRRLVHTLAAERWAKLDEETKQKYIQKGTNLRRQYYENLKQYNSEIQYNFEQADKEQRAFKSSLRQKLRSSSLIPTNTRNSFCFFLSENIHNQPRTVDNSFQALSERWKELPEGSKEKYLELVALDRVRYLSDRGIYDMLREITFEPSLNKKSDAG